MELIDTHAHLYHEQLSGDIGQVIERCKQQGVKAVVLPNINEHSVQPLLNLCERSDDIIQFYPAMGLHPCDVKENVEEQLLFFKNEMDKKKYYAVGETGLDFYWDLTYKEQQIFSFKKHLEWAISYNLPVIIHSRNSTRACIDIVKAYGRQVKGVFHCFSGTYEEALEIIALGMYLGIGGSITYKNSKPLQEAIQKIGLEHIVLETDAPFLSPEPHRGKRNESSYIIYTAHFLAKLKGIDVNKLCGATSYNAKVLFNIQYNSQHSKS
ncbi:MAG: TatD family hydrolase [Chitinophagales bacterium]|nr:TatD family hydrolase [Chitinophagales bacterium]MDW8273201.1 TatD family hydrolase [Chitinophagales bacterium]